MSTASLFVHANPVQIEDRYFFVVQSRAHYRALIFDMPLEKPRRVALTQLRLDSTRLHFELPTETENVVFDGQIGNGTVIKKAKLCPSVVLKSANIATIGSPNSSRSRIPVNGGLYDEFSINRP